MPDAAHDPLLHRPRIGAGAQHLDIVIRLRKEHATAAKMVAHADGHVAEIGGEANLDALGAKGEANGVDRVVGDIEGHDFDIADAKASTGGKVFRLWKLG